MLTTLNTLIYIYVELNASNVCENLENKSTYSLLIDWRTASCPGYSKGKTF
jgi:hypothetical protein